MQATGIANGEGKLGLIVVLHGLLLTLLFLVSVMLGRERREDWSAWLGQWRGALFLTLSKGRGRESKRRFGKESKEEALAHASLSNG